MFAVRLVMPDTVNAFNDLRGAPPCLMLTSAFTASVRFFEACFASVSEFLALVAHEWLYVLSDGTRGETNVDASSALFHHFV